MGEWIQTTLGEVVQLQRGHDLPTQDRRPGAVPIVGSFGITGWHDTAKAKGPGVAIGRSGASFGTAAYVEGDYWPLNTCLYVTDFRGNDPRWVFSLLHEIDFSGYNSGSAQPSLNRNFLAKIPVRKPPVDEQQRIAGVLGALDDLIETNRELVSVLWDRIKAAYSRAAMGGEIKQLGDALRLGYGRGLRADARVPGPFPVVSSAGVVGTHDTKLVDGPGIVVGRKGTVGSVTWVFDDFYPIDTAFYVETDLPMIYVYFALRDAGLEAMNTDSAVPGLNRENALRRPIRLPSAATLAAFDREADVYLAAIRGLDDEIADLTRARDELLPLLMSGRVRVREVA